jgi:hypothetical protein
MDVARTYTPYVLSAAAAYGIYRAARFLSHPTPLKDIPGPPAQSIVFGNFKEIAAASETDALVDLFEKWTTLYGTTIGYRGLFNVRQCFHLCHGT